MTVTPKHIREAILLDKEDEHLLVTYDWTLGEDGYLRAYSDYKTLYLHRLICVTELTVDHKNKNKLDNRKDNLRPATYSQNNANIGKRKTNTSGYIGVTYREAKRLYQVMCASKYVGSFTCIKQAALAYNQAALKKFGEFAVLNEVIE